MRYVDNNHTRFMRKQVQRTNDHLRGARITLGEDKVISPHYVRIFNDSLEQGGRLYEGSQNLPKDLRRKILIDGSATAEADFDELHAKLLCLQAGITPEPGAYDVDGHERKDVKVGTLIMLNARTERSGLGAMTKHIFPKDGAPFEKARKLAAAIKSKHRRIERHFFSDAGVRLQHDDSEIMINIHERCMADDIPMLSIHDSCRAPIGEIGTVTEHMAAAFRRQTGSSACSISTY